MIELFHVVAILWFFALGAVVGSFLNVCIYRLPWEKSLLWPGSHCPRCLSAIAPWDNIPIVSWLALRGECRRCGLPIAPRYMLIELGVGLLFAALYAVDVVRGPHALLAWEGFARLGYHAVLVALLVAATFTDYDYQVIPDAITRPGTLFGLAAGTAFPLIRPEPTAASTAFGAAVPGLAWGAAGAGAAWIVGVFVAAVFRSGEPAKADPHHHPDEHVGLPAIGFFLGWHVGVVPRAVQWGGLVVGVEGLLVGAALVWFFRTFGRIVFRREAMGFGDLTLMMMIGAFLGWQAAVLTFFGSSFIGLGHALWKLAALVVKIVTRRKSSAADREMPLGPYLAMAALVLVLGWPTLVADWGDRLFSSLGVVVRFALTGDLGGA